MNWLVIALVGGAAVWFEYSYQRSRRQSKRSPQGATHRLPESARVAQPGEGPSVALGAENDQKLNTTA